jgi:hypothetical protein
MLRAGLRPAKLYYCRQCRGKVLVSLHDSTSYATAVSLKGKAKANDGPSIGFAEQLEAQGAGILRVVRSKMEERGRLLREIVRAQLIILCILKRRCL